MENLNVVVAGHIDHGKSTLIGRLLYETNSLPQVVVDEIKESEALGREKGFAFITDQLAEEQAGSITIDTTQIEFKTPRRSYTLIDTPGHREFLKNMITGATRADAAVLVVDVSQGLLEQTYRHTYLMAMLGIKDIVIVANKMDLAFYSQGRFEELTRHIHDFIGRLHMRIVAIVPVSAHHGENISEPSDAMPWNTSPTFVASLNDLSARRDLSTLPLRFLVQCPYATNGTTTILGKVASGALHRHQPLTFAPTRLTTRVLSVQVSNRERTTADAGESVALIVEEAAGVGRGQVGFDVRHPPLVTDRLIADVFWIGATPLAPANEMDILCGTQRCPARVETISEAIDPAHLDEPNPHADELAESQVGNVTIRLSQPLCVDPFNAVPELGRFAITRGGRIAGGGIIRQ